MGRAGWAWLGQFEVWRLLVAGRRLEAGVGGWCPLVVHCAGQFRLNHESDLLLDLVLGEGKVVDRGSWEQALTGTRYPTLPGFNFYYPYPTRKSFENFRVQGSNYTWCFHPELYQ